MREQEKDGKDHYYISLLSAILVNPYAAGGLFDQYKMMQKAWQMMETLAHGYSSESTQQELSNEYQHDRVLNVCFAAVYVFVMILYINLLMSVTANTYQQ